MKSEYKDLQELVRKAKQGDRDAFALLYADISRKLYSTAFYLLGRQEDAEDLVMDTVTDAFRTINLLRDESAFDCWIMKILVNKAKKKRGYYINEPVELDERLIFNNNDGSDDRIILWKAIDKLSSDEQEILILGIVNGYHSDEIANILHMNSNTVRSKRKRALEKLKSILEEGGYVYD